MRFAGTLAVTTPSETELEVVRRFDAPRDLVFAALTQPALLRRWHGADGWDLVVCDVDLRVGGAWRFVARGPAGEPDMGYGGEFVEVEPPSRLVQTERFDDAWYTGIAHVTTDLAESDGVTTLRMRIRYASREVRDAVVASPMSRGMTEGYDRLARLLATEEGDVS
ncbi:Activator of Hsp90 ATPase 1 family protein [Beutenbergia cavernae DSM 12333]|uniref:Activator of Hsp90 ATPase 1 family protein n=1 Tax=Beutenbergia cavernae (strain ATCC BAA-8 / DSM 12333 / CCUG 43141 / JCM 11478 / NBRC 16432 / NCIMB 13614 / HKI 0122) TaxID=471853 RepID=C5BYY9_BEUC1|nr:SRPBCC family protein [Beutenbergia cavernae]ACQ81104.1 Activator of Hsp90 ATPase 1 family protein [Beutenbergia cavernae DSM 12333]